MNSKLLLIILFLMHEVLTANQLFIGMRTWQGTWEPGQLKKAENDAFRRTLKARIKGQEKLELVPLASSKASGLYSGPVISYITDNRKWSFGFVGLAGKSGKMGLTNTSASNEVQSSVNLTSNSSNSFEFEPKRLDLDFSVSYAILRYMKFFVAFKHQSYDYDSEANLQGNFSGRINPGQFTETAFSTRLFGKGQSKIMYSYNGPAAGIAFSIPVNETSSISLSGAYFSSSGLVEDLLWFQTSNFRNDELKFNELFYNQLKTTMTLKGYTSEITYNTMASENVLIQFGYRIQHSTIDIQYTWAEDTYIINQNGQQFNREPYPGAKFQDIFQGFTFSAIYRFKELF